MILKLPLKQLNLIPPQEFFGPVWNSLAEDKVWLAGGAVNKWLSGDLVIDTDFDIFSWSPTKLISRFGPIHQESKFAFTFNIVGTKVQVIRRPFSTIEDVLNSFDFTARMVGIDQYYLYYHQTALEDIADKKIIMNPPGDWNVKSLVGIVKYANRGYTISHEESRKFLIQWGVDPKTIFGDGQS